MLDSLWFRATIGGLLLLTYAWGPHSGGVTSYEEVFGNPNHYLALHFSTNPKGILQRYEAFRSLPFTGTLVVGDNEESIWGTKNAAHYSFQYRGKRLAGKLERTVKGCEPQLRLITTGVLRAAFCDE